MNRREVLQQYGILGIFGMAPHIRAMGAEALKSTRIPERIPLPPPDLNDAVKSTWGISDRTSIDFRSGNKVVKVTLLNDDYLVLAQLFSELLSRAGIPHDIG